MRGPRLELREGVVGADGGARPRGERQLGETGVVPVDQDDIQEPRGLQRAAGEGRVHLDPGVRGCHHAAPGVLDDAGDRRPTAVRGGSRIDEAHTRLRQVGAQELGCGARPEGAEQDGPRLAGAARARFQGPCSWGVRPVAVVGIARTGGPRAGAQAPRRALEGREGNGGVGRGPSGCHDVVGRGHFHSRIRNVVQRVYDVQRGQPCEESVHGLIIHWRPKQGMGCGRPRHHDQSGLPPPPTGK